MGPLGALFTMSMLYGILVGVLIDWVYHRVRG